MKTSLRFAGLFLGEILIVAIVIFYVTTGGNHYYLLNYFRDDWSFIGIVAGAFVILLVSGLLKDFGKAFILAFREEVEVAEGKRSCLALQCAMISVSVWSILVTIVGVVAAQDGLILEPMEPFVVAEINALCAGLPSGGIMLLLLLCPIYYRLKRLTII